MTDSDLSEQKKAKLDLANSFKCSDHSVYVRGNSSYIVQY